MTRNGLDSMEVNVYEGAVDHCRMEVLGPPRPRAGETSGEGGIAGCGD